MQSKRPANAGLLIFGARDRYCRGYSDGVSGAASASGAASDSAFSWLATSVSVSVGLGFITMIGSIHLPLIEMSYSTSQPPGGEVLRQKLASLFKWIKHLLGVQFRARFNPGFIPSSLP